MIKSLVSAVLILSASTAAIGQESRQDLIHQIVEAQGIQKTLTEQLAQQREGMEKYGSQIYSQIVEGFGGQESDKTKAVFEKFMRDVSDLVKIDEMVSAWESSYGAGLTDKELVGILAYYESDIGKKDVASGQAATAKYTAWALAAYQERSTALLNSFVTDIKACY